MDRELPLVVLEEHACLPVVVIEPDASQETSEIEYGAAPLIPFPIEKKSLMDSVCHSLLLFFSDTISPFSSFDALFILKGFSLRTASASNTSHVTNSSEGTNVPPYTAVKSDTEYR